MSSETTSVTEPERLPRMLGVWDGTALVVGSIIGSGIFLKPGNVGAYMAPYGFVAVMGVWAIVGLATLCGALALAELAAMFPHAGGPYVYLRKVYGRLPAFLWGWTEMLVVRTASMGALACATALYLNQIVPLTKLQQEIAAISIIVSLAIANAVSTRWGANVQNLFTIIKVSFLAIIITVPIMMLAGRFDHMQPLIATPALGTTTGTFWSALGLALVAVMWPFDGWINVAPVAEDIRDPQKNVPKALTWGLLIVIAVYLGANFSYHYVMPMADVVKTKTIASDVFGVLFGSVGAMIAAAGVMCSTFGATNSNMICGPRISLAMARDGMLPASIHQLHPRWKTPANAIIGQTVWTIALIVFFFAWKDEPKAAFDGLTDAVITAGIIFYSLTVAAVYLLRHRLPNEPRSYRTWGYPITPAIFLVVYAFVFTRLILDQWRETLGVLVLIAAGIAYYAVRVRTQAGRVHA